MLTGNLATRPFYNERLVRGVLVVALAAATAWAAVNAATVVSLSQQSAMLSERARTEGLRAAAVRTDADTVRRGIDDWNAYFDLVKNGTVDVAPKSMNEEQKWLALKAPFVAIDVDSPLADPRTAPSAHPRAFGTFPRVIDDTSSRCGRARRSWA